MSNIQGPLIHIDPLIHRYEYPESSLSVLLLESIGGFSVEIREENSEKCVPSGYD